MEKPSLIQHLEAKEEAKKDFEKAKERFRDKSFYEDWKPLSNYANLSRKFLPFLSIITGTTTIVILLNLFIPLLWLSIPIAIAFLMFWESVKCKLLIKSFELFYIKKFNSTLGLFIVCLVFTGGSIFFSLNGFYELSKQFDNTEKTVKNGFKLQIDSVQNRFDNLIADAKGVQNAYFKANNYKGIITYTKDRAIAKHYEKLSGRVLELEQEKADEINKLEARQTKTIEVEQIDYWEKVKYALIGVLLIEFLIVFSNWYVVFFDYKLHSQYLLVLNNNSQQPPLNAIKFPDFFDPLQFQNQYNSQANFEKEKVSTTNQSIGFKPATAATKNSFQSNGNADKSLATDDKKSTTDYSLLIAEIKAGKRDYRYLMKEYQVNVKQLTQLINEYGLSRKKEELIPLSD